MEVLVVFAMLVAVAWSAALVPGELPMDESLANQYLEYQQRFLRDKRSSYPGTYYAPAPCGAALPPYIAPVHHAAAPLIAPAIPHYGGYGAPLYPSLPHYRDADEMLSFSDMDQMQQFEQMPQHSMFEPTFDHVPMARYSYGPAAAIPAIGASAAGLAGVAPASASGPAIGVFPNANTGGCSIPLLLSCSPSVKPGHIVKSPGYSYGGDSYRGVDEMQQTHEAHQEAAHEGLAPAHDAALAPGPGVPRHQ